MWPDPSDFDLCRSLKLSVQRQYSYLELFGELDKLDVIFVATLYDKIERSYWQNTIVTFSPSDLDLGASSFKISRKETHDTGDLWLHMEVERSKVKIMSQVKTVPVSKRDPQLVAPPGE